MPLNRQQRLALGRQRRATPQAVPIPITGWNTRDALTGMAPTDAIQLDNWYPDAGGCTTRKGYVQFASGVGAGAVATLHEHHALGIRKLLAAGGGKIYDISAGGAAGSPLGSGFTSDWWNTFTFNNHSFFFNGIDTPQIFDGTALSAQTWTLSGGPATSLANLTGGTAFQNAVYLTAKNGAGFYFGPLLAITGTLTWFDLSMLSTQGGNLAAITSFSYDGGAGVFDYIVFLMDTGEAFLYSGNDPAIAGDFSLVGVYQLSPPVSQRAVVRYGGESYVTTLDDHIAVQQGLVAARTGLLPPRTKASGAVAAAVAANLTANGWQNIYYKGGRRILFNIPNPDGSFDQHVYNLTNDAWCRFKGMPAACWATFGASGSLYFGVSSGGLVYQADTGSLDNGVQAISCIGQQAWNNFGSADRKAVKAARPVLETGTGFSYVFGLGFDFQFPGEQIIAENAFIAGSPWDVSPWDTSPWSPESEVDPDWQIGGGDGVSISWALSLDTMTQITWLRTDCWLEPGTGL